MDEILEKLSRLEHEQWCEWSEAISVELSALLDIAGKVDESKLNDDEKELILNVHRRLERWKGLWVPYDELSEESKEQDRVYARKAISIFSEKL